MALTDRDKEELIGMINTMVSQVPSFLRGSLSSKNLSQYMQAIPPAFRRYTVQEILDTLDEANSAKRFKF